MLEGITSMQKWEGSGVSLLKEWMKEFWGHFWRKSWLWVMYLIRWVYRFPFTNKDYVSLFTHGGVAKEYLVCATKNQLPRCIRIHLKKAAEWSSWDVVITKASQRMSAIVWTTDSCQNYRKDLLCLKKAVE